MSRAAAIQLKWLPRERPLAPCAVAAQGEAARGLAIRLLERTEAELGRLQGVAGREMLVIRGEADLLPWVEGVVYMGQERDAPTLLLPTALRPDFPCALLERALRAQFPAAAPPLAVLPETQQVISLAAARTVARTSLQAWLEGKL